MPVDREVASAGAMAGGEWRPITCKTDLDSLMNDASVRNVGTPGKLEHPAGPIFSPRTGGTPVAPCIRQRARA
jgi:hypothetical protein